MMSTERERGREEGHKILTIRELKVNLVLTGTDRLGTGPKNLADVILV